VFIRGCTTLGILNVRDINVTQPDKEDPTAPAAGAGPATTGPTYTLSASSTTTKIVDRCRDRSGTTFNAGTPQFEACLKDAAYSSYFKFTTDRVIIK
jgi:hypothetical protein